MPAKRKLKVVVASTVYHFEDQLNQICAVMNGFGYTVWNSHIGTMPVDPALSNLENCVAAVRDCDFFLGVVRPFYGSGVIGPRSIFHEECLEAIRLAKPRWFLVHRDVTFARQLLKPYMFRRNGDSTNFVLKKNPVMDDIRVIQLYNDAIQNDVPAAERRGHWAQEFYRLPEALEYLDSQFKEVKRIRRICEEMRGI
jgi:Domain of unknown function (DUF4062)